MANPTPRQRLIMQVLLDAPARGLQYLRTAAVDNFLDANALQHYQVGDGTYGLVPVPDCLEVMARALEASRAAGNNVPIDAILAGERARYAAELTAQSNTITADATAKSGESTAIAGVALP